MRRVRTMVKRGAERLIVATGMPRMVRHLRNDDVAVLAYHNVLPQGEPKTGDRSLHLPQEAFSRQLDLLCETHDIVTLDALFEPSDGGRMRPRAAITFDDAYQGALTAGMAELQKRGLPATVFVSPGCLEQEAFWWDQLADPDEGVVPHEVRRHSFTALAGRGGEILDWARSAGLRIESMPEHCRPASRRLLARVIAENPVVLGSHTWSHPSLPGVKGDDLLFELQRSREWLERCFGRPCEWLAYPYGHTSPSVAECAAQYYNGGFRVSGGLTQPRPLQSRRFRLSRINVPSGMSLEGFQLRLCGIR
jgi:peptidoglycan/xylan/chitin deacetylase (PgdA/CDA1 family)